MQSNDLIREVKVGRGKTARIEYRVSHPVTGKVCPFLGTCLSRKQAEIEAERLIKAQEVAA